MASVQETVDFDSLLAEQEAVQASKHRGRLLDTYEQTLFPYKKWREPPYSAMNEYVQQFCSGAEPTIATVLQTLHNNNGGEPVTWVDMGGGRGLAMRQFNCKPDAQEKYKTINVDLFDWQNADPILPEELEKIRATEPDIYAPEKAPLLVQADAERIKFEDPIHLVTSIEGIQYLNNPLAALCNWYNQLADDGLLLIATDHQWAEWIRYPFNPDNPHDNHEPPMQAVLETLEAAGIEMAADAHGFGNESWKLDPKEICRLALRKKAGTRLVVDSTVTNIWVNPYDYKAVYYKRPTNETETLLHVERLANFSLNALVPRASKE